MECPTCFQRLVIPPAGTGADSKLVLTASLAHSPRPTVEVPARGRTRGGQRTWKVAKWTLSAALVASFVFGIYLFRGEVMRAVTGKLKQWNTAIHGRDQRSEERVPNPKPGSGWTLDVNKVLVPESVVAGRVRGKPFQCARAGLSGGHLTLKQGTAWPAGLSLTIQFYAERPEDLVGKTIEVAADRPPPVPAVVVHWLDEEGRPDEQVITSGYVMLARFGEIQNGRLPGQLYLAVPDEMKSYAAGLFEAEVVPKKANPITETNTVAGAGPE
jgi:hypothetical protein